MKGLRLPEAKHALCNREGKPFSGLINITIVSKWRRGGTCFAGCLEDLYTRSESPPLPLFRPRSGTPTQKIDFISPSYQHSDSYQKSMLIFAHPGQRLFKILGGEFRVEGGNDPFFLHGLGC